MAQASAVIIDLEEIRRRRASAKPVSQDREAMPMVPVAWCAPTIGYAFVPMWMMVPCWTPIC